MHFGPFSPRFSRTLFLGALLGLAACQSDGSRPPPAPPSPVGRKAEISNEFIASAQVVAVSPTERVLTLRREDGTQIDLLVGQDVRNFDHIAPGDALKVRYRETLAAELRPAGEAIGPIEGGLVAARAKPGAKPAAGVGVGLSLRVRIESIDRDRNIAVFSLGSGELIARRVQTPQGREFLSNLKVGDIVQLDYKEAAAISIEKP